MPGPRGLAPMSRAHSTSSNAFSASMEIETCRTRKSCATQQGFKRKTAFEAQLQQPLKLMLSARECRKLRKTLAAGSAAIFMLPTVWQDMHSGIRP